MRPPRKTAPPPQEKKTAPKRRKTSEPRTVQRGEPIVAKLFANGRSQAVRPPKEFRLPGTEVRISRAGNRVILEPIGDDAVDANGWRIGFWEEMDRLRKGVNLDEYQVPDDPVPPPIKSMDAP